MFKRKLWRSLIFCSLIATFMLSTAAFADPSAGGGSDGPGQYAGVPDEIQTRQPPPPPPSPTGKVTGTDWTVTSSSTTSSGTMTLSTTRSTLSWQAMLTTLRLELRVLVLRF